MRKIVEVFRDHFACFMFDGDSKLGGTAAVHRILFLFWKIKVEHTFLQVAVVLLDS